MTAIGDLRRMVPLNSGEKLFFTGGNYLSTVHPIRWTVRRPQGTPATEIFGRKTTPTATLKIIYQGLTPLGGERTRN
jgi:hypothetical protein